MDLGEKNQGCFKKNQEAALWCMEGSKKLAEVVKLFIQFDFFITCK